MQVVALLYAVRAALSVGSALTFLAASRTASVFFFQDSLLPLGGVFLPSSSYSETNLARSSLLASPRSALLRSESCPPLWAISMTSLILYFGFSLSAAARYPPTPTAAATTARQSNFLIDALSLWDVRLQRPPAPAGTSLPSLPAPGRLERLKK